MAQEDTAPAPTASWRAHQKLPMGLVVRRRRRYRLILMDVAATVKPYFAAWFFRNFFHMLLIASSCAMWLVPVWVVAALGWADIPLWLHGVGIVVTYAFNRSIVRRPRRVATPWLRRYSAVAFVLLICSTFLVASLSLFAVAIRFADLVDPAASQALASVSRWWGLSGILGLSAAMIFGYTGGQRQLCVNRVSVHMPHWRGALRVLQLSDIHVGQNLSLDQLEKFVARANAEGPDLVCITGDIADGPGADMERFFPVLARLQARFGIIAILGNHDHYVGGDRVEAALRKVGIEVLRDRGVTLDLGGDRLHVIGLDDRGRDWARGVQDDHVLSELLAGAPREVPKLLLVHRPDVFTQAAREGIELTLSGHTHGGQLAVPWFGGRRRNLAEFMTRFDRGLFRSAGSSLYVNCGLGVTGQRVRLFTPREISVFDLRGGRAVRPPATQRVQAAVPLVVREAV